MFTPDQERAAAELARVCRPGGTIAVANWTPTSFVGQIFRDQVRSRPGGGQAAGPVGHRGAAAGAARPGGVAPRDHPTAVRVPVPLPDEFVDFFRTTYGPVHKAFLALDEPDRERLHADLAILATQFDRGPGPSVAMPSDYLEAVAVRS
jgi:hypothetical protein